MRLMGPMSPIPNLTARLVRALYLGLSEAPSAPAVRDGPPYLLRLSIHARSMWHEKQPGPALWT
jgi:hypothetical protein